MQKRKSSSPQRLLLGLVAAFVLLGFHALGWPKRAGAVFAFVTPRILRTQEIGQ
jgi:hypothetical protein